MPRGRAADPDVYDALVVGGGPAGTSAALWLGRCRRRTLLVDGGATRNRASRAVHGFLTRDPIAPSEFARLARADLRKYPTVRRRRGLVVGLDGRVGRFIARLGDGTRVQARCVVLATGVRDELPSWPGARRFYGVSLHHCPHCDGWEWRDRPLAALGPDAAGMARMLLTWSDRVTWFTDGHREARVIAAARRAGIAVETRAITRLEGRGRQLGGVRLADGTMVGCDAGFIVTACGATSGLSGAIGCRPLAGKPHLVRTTANGRTGVPGVYVAGDASRNAQLVIVAAAEGALCAIAADRFLRRSDHSRIDRGRAPLSATRAPSRRRRAD